MSGFEVQDARHFYKQVRLKAKRRHEFMESLRGKKRDTISSRPHHLKSDRGPYNDGSGFTIGPRKKLPRWLS